MFEMHKRILLLLLLVSILPNAARANFYSPVAIAIFPPVQFPGNDFSIVGARISALWGNQRDVYGLDLGLVGNITQQDFVGVGVSGLFNYTKGTTTAIGVQLAGLTNVNTGKTMVNGIQAAIALNYNSAASQVNGLQIAAVNLADHTDIWGIQAGIYNHALNVYGIQLGLVNICDNLHGIQIGLVNFHRKGTISVSPIINVGF